MSARTQLSTSTYLLADTPLPVSPEVLFLRVLNPISGRGVESSTLKFVQCSGEVRRYTKHVYYLKSFIITESQNIPDLCQNVHLHGPCDR